MLTNILVIVLFIRQDKYKFDQQIFIINVNVADLLGLLAATILVGLISYTDPLNNNFTLFFCEVLGYLNPSIFSVSAVNFCLVVFHRYMLVTKLGYYKKVFTKFNCILMICFSWLVPFGINGIAILTRWSQIQYISRKKFCSYNYPHFLSYTLFTLLLFTVLPTIFVITFYSFLYMRVIKHRAKIQNQKSKSTIGTTSREIKLLKDKKEQRLMLQLMSITCLFMICWIPGSTVGRFIGYDDNSNDEFGTISSALLCLNSIINPLIYIIPNPVKRNELKKLFCFYGSKYIFCFLLENI